MGHDCAEGFIKIVTVEENDSIFAVLSKDGVLIYDLTKAEKGPYLRPIAEYSQRNQVFDRLLDISLDA